MGSLVVRPDPGSLTDEELLRRYHEGEVQAFGVLLERYRRPVYNFILRSVRDRERAEDLLQDVFLRVVQRSGDFKGESKFSTWLYTIARNLCIDTSRKMVFRRHRSLDAPVRSSEGDGTALVERVASEKPAVDRDAIAQELQARIAEAVEELPEEQREVFLMRQVQNLPFKEIAEIVGVPENTVKSRMRYALERLQAALSEYEDYAHQLR
jgi:RNA polymerase sigma-70 factor (ECF subfamily)